MDIQQHNSLGSPKYLRSYSESASITVGTQHAPVVKNMWTQTCAGPTVALPMTSTPLTGCQYGSEGCNMLELAANTCLHVARSISCSRPTSRTLTRRHGHNVKGVRNHSLGPLFAWLAPVTHN